MKIIDLINMVANDEYLPFEIIYDDRKWELNPTGNDYIRKTSDNRTEHLFDDYMVYTNKTLNEEVKLTDEENDIAEIDQELIDRISCENKTPISNNLSYAMNKINELIKEVNKLKGVMNGMDN